jgi:hypothetical protein
MLAKLKSFHDIINDRSVDEVKRNNHYWKFYYTDKPALGFRDFYLKYWKGDRHVSIKPKRDRKKNIIPGKYEVYGKRGNYVFTIYECWLEWKQPEPDYTNYEAELKPDRPVRVIAKKSLVNLPWDDLFEV